MSQAMGGVAKAALLFLAAAAGARAADAPPATLADCARVADDGLRLQCYDRLATQSDAAIRPRPAIIQADDPERGASRLADHWELEPESKRGTFVFRPHRPNYVLLANYSSAPNNAPFRPFADLVRQDGGLSHTELTFQLGFKLKLLEDIFPRRSDLWFGYTQENFWQAYNRRASSPFREIDYQPELMLVTPVDFHFLGLHGRFVNVGLVHQSNGQATTLSRSWNRIYLQAGMEKGDFTLLARIWQRLRFSSVDDNPDILDYMGHGDIVATYRWRGQEFSLLARRNFRADRGALQLGWAFPLTRGLNGYVRVFSGYGQSLIDYNYFQHALGVGISIGF